MVGFESIRIRPSTQSRTQSPRAFWSAGDRSTADQKPRGIWLRDFPSPRFQILCGFETFHSGVVDLHAGFTGYVWNEGESVKKKLRIKKHPDTCGRGLNFLA